MKNTLIVVLFVVCGFACTHTFVDLGECESDMDCADGDPCTIDICGVDHTCVQVPADNPSCDPVDNRDAGTDVDSDTEVDDYEGDEPGECTDGADNDRDGRVDCADPDCAPSPVCETPPGADADADTDSDSGIEAGEDASADADADADADVDATDVPTPYCGDGACNGGETLLTCSRDCGTCRFEWNLAGSADPPSACGSWWYIWDRVRCGDWIGLSAETPTTACLDALQVRLALPPGAEGRIYAIDSAGNILRVSIVDPARADGPTWPNQLGWAFSF